jgi:methyltransferase (TIGR00027 family)
MGVAKIRAAESRRADRLFDEPYAGAFVVAAPAAFADEQRAAARAPATSPMAKWGETFAAHAVLRTRFFDDYLRSAADRRIRQIVLPAAGLDTRAFRLAWPAGTRLYEVDLPDMLRFKEAVLADQAAEAGCQRHVVPADLRGDITSALTEAGLSANDRTAWLLEGLLIYLSAEDAERLLSSITDLSAPGSRLATEFDNEGADRLRARVQQVPTMRRYATMWKGGMPKTLDWLAAHGWQTTQHQRSTVAADYRRALPNPTPGSFITATRR